MAIIGDAVAGADFERSEPLAARCMKIVGHEGVANAAAEGVDAMKVLTANRLTDGEAVWCADGGWAETIGNADLAHDKDGRGRGWKQSATRPTPTTKSSTSI